MNNKIRIKFKYSIFSGSKYRISITHNRMRANEKKKHVWCKRLNTTGRNIKM